jgi:voltage-gated potassium channel
VLVPLLFAFGLVCTTVIVHALGTLEAIAHLGRIWQRRRRTPGQLAAEFQIVRTVAILLCLHLAEALIWAAFYLAANVLPDFETSVYFSITSYTTMGYGDVVLHAPWRLLGPIEGAVGILMFGWSTAIIVTAVGRFQGPGAWSAPPRERLDVPPAL